MAALGGGPAAAALPEEPEVEPDPEQGGQGGAAAPGGGPAQAPQAPPLHPPPPPGPPPWAYWGSLLEVPRVTPPGLGGSFYVIWFIPGWTELAGVHRCVWQDILRLLPNQRCFYGDGTRVTAGGVAIEEAVRIYLAGARSHRAPAHCGIWLWR